MQTLNPYKLLLGAGHAAGNRSMQRAGRAKWNMRDYLAAARVVAELLKAMWRSKL